MAIEITTPCTTPEYYKAKRNLPRFPPDLDNDLKGVQAYYRNQAIKALHAGLDGPTWSGDVTDLKWGAKTTFNHNGVSYTSIYVYSSARNSGNMSEYIRSHPNERFCTTPHCELEAYFKNSSDRLSWLFVDLLR